MASRSYTIPPKTPARGTVNKSLKSSSKRKTPTFSSVDTLGGGDNIESPRRTSKKRKLDAVSATANEDEDKDEVAAAYANAALAGIGSESKRSRRAGKGGPREEKRLRPFRKHPPKTYLDRLDRVRTQRMFLIDRERMMSEDGTHQEEAFVIAGTTGNVYEVTINKTPTCTCPDYAKGNQCKHIVYILVNVLKAPEHLAYQLAFLCMELDTLFALAPNTPQFHSLSPHSPSAGSDAGGKRKGIEGDCPVCVMEFDPASEEIVWCRAACGNNIHKQCFEQWAASKAGVVKCVFCRTPWKGDEDSIKRISKMGRKNEDGYINVAGELGLSGVRDYTSYHQPWVRQQYGYMYGGRSF